MKIKEIKSREILDSRGDPTVEVELFLEEGIRTIASVPSGASVGSHEALEIRDNDPARFGGMGVLKAINNIQTIIAPVLSGQEILRIKDLDKILIELDGTEHKSKLGANATLAISIACTKALAAEKNLPVYKYIAEVAGTSSLKIPIAMFNFIEGAKHAENNLQIQEFLAIPEQPNFKESYRQASENFHNLKKILQERKLGISVGHEGGFAPDLENDEQAIQLITNSGKLRLALDMAGVQPKNFSIDQMLAKYPIVSLEDPLAEDDWQGWVDLTQKYANKILVVGDDLLATNVSLLLQAVQKKAVTAVIVKPNQVGTVSEAIDFVLKARQANLKIVTSHRSGESEDTFIADFAVGIGSDFLKFGAPSRGERVSKYNRLLRIEEEISGK